MADNVKAGMVLSILNQGSGVKDWAHSRSRRHSKK